MSEFPKRLHTSTYDGNFGYLPILRDDLWAHDIMGWESSAWAAIQTTVADYAIGVEKREPLANNLRVNDTSQWEPGEKELCGVQRMRGPAGIV
jgi:hypothetical protein